jgi:hypothetical protein
VLDPDLAATLEELARIDNDGGWRFVLVGALFAGFVHRESQVYLRINLNGIEAILGTQRQSRPDQAEKQSTFSSGLIWTFGGPTPYNTLVVET